MEDQLRPESLRNEGGEILTGSQLRLKGVGGRAFTLQMCCLKGLGHAILGNFV